MLGIFPIDPNAEENRYILQFIFPFEFYESIVVFKEPKKSADPLNLRAADQSTQVENKFNAFLIIMFLNHLSQPLQIFMNLADE